jgi:hypothetical protein
MAWVADVDYQLWQNSDDATYESFGRPWKHLPVKRHPGGWTVVDPSGNPG